MLQTVTGQTQINLPDNYEELLIEVDYENGGLVYVFNVNKLMIGSYRKKFNQGYYYNTSTYSLVTVIVTSTTAWLNNISVGDKDILSLTKVSLYYR